MDITYVDISGKGDTNFVTIENERRSNRDMDYLSNWDQSTAEPLLESISYQNKLNIPASGGLRTPLDVIKSLALGARAAGMSRPLLNQVEHAGITSTIKYVESFIDHMKPIMTMLDAEDINDLKQSRIVSDSKLMSWIEQRHLKVERG